MPHSAQSEDAEEGGAREGDNLRILPRLQQKGLLEPARIRAPSDDPTIVVDPA